MEILYPRAIHSDPSGAANQSVTVLVNCSVATAGREVFMTTLQELLEAFRCSPGTIGSDVFEREAGEVIHLTIAQRFSTLADHEAWLQSDAFIQWKSRVAPAQTQPVHRYYGMEVIFGASVTSDAPPRWKMFVILTISAIPISWALSHWFGQTLAAISPLTGALMTSQVMVALMNYVMTPLLSRIFDSWLQPSPGKKASGSKKQSHISDPVRVSHSKNSG